MSKAVRPKLIKIKREVKSTCLPRLSVLSLIRKWRVYSIKTIKWKEGISWQ